MSIRPTDVQRILRQHFNRVVVKEPPQRINVRRQLLPHDAFRQFKRASFDPTKLLRVTFVGESAVDDGGPRREFFRLLLADLFTTCGFFTGYPSAVTAIHNVISLEDGDFAIAAKMIGASIVQGGPAPHCFSASVADFIVYGDVRSPVQLNDITDLDVQLKMAKVCYYGFPGGGTFWISKFLLYFSLVPGPMTFLVA